MTWVVATTRAIPPVSVSGRTRLLSQKGVCSQLVVEGVVVVVDEEVVVVEEEVEVVVVVVEEDELELVDVAIVESVVVS